MSKTFLETIQDRVLIADGGIASEIYNRGFFLNCCYEDLNLTAGKVIQEIHESFVNSGSEILTANTFGANPLVLNGYGIREKTGEINRKGVELARAAIKNESGFVIGSIGALPDELLSGEPEATVQDSYKEHAQSLIDAGADALCLESFPNLQQLEAAYKAVSGMNCTVICSLLYSSVVESGVENVINTLRGWGVSLFGVNGGGPQETLDLLPELTNAAGDSMKIYVRPSAGQPQLVNGRLFYLASPEYMAEFARRYVQKGAAIVGGDSGITPAMIREMRSFLRSVQPGKKVLIEITKEEMPEEAVQPKPVEERSVWGAKIGKQFAISVELDPPKGIDATKSVEGAKFLYENGIDAVNIADGPRATGRMSPTALALLVRREVPIETIIHVCCRDRNVLALQMDLISANALGLRNLMLITGDPPKMGIYPDATAVFDFDAIGLISSANLLNHGLDFAKRPLGGQTEFVLGTGCNPGATDLELEAHRLELKIKAGAEYVFSQPVYDPELLENFLKRIKNIKQIPFFVGILPLASYKNAEFLHNNVPGMQIPEEIRERMRKATTKEEQRKEGIKIAAEALKEAKQHPNVKGSYIFPPFGRYASILDVLELAGIR